MILVTVGTDGPFDRMVKVVDQWAKENQRKDVFAQIGEGGWRPEHIAWSEILNPSDFSERFQNASLIIGHAGMGTILTALSKGKAILVMPKKASLGEHRNEHQLATAKHLLKLGKVNVAFEEAELRKSLDDIDSLMAKEPIGRYAEQDLIAGINTFIHGGERN